MKIASLILGVLLLTSPGVSYAGGAGGSGGGDKFEQVSFAGCEDGRRQPFTEHDGNDRSKTVWRTCVDGRYYPKAKPVRIIKCRDGSTYRETVSDGGRGSEITKICDDGKFVDIRSVL